MMRSPERVNGRTFSRTARHSIDSSKVFTFFAVLLSSVISDAIIIAAKRSS